MSRVPQYAQTEAPFVMSALQAGHRFAMIALLPLLHAGSSALAFRVFQHASQPCSRVLLYSDKCYGLSARVAAAGRCRIIDGPFCRGETDG